MLKKFFKALKLSCCLTVGGLLFFSVASAEKGVIVATDGQIMSNPNVWKHQILDGDWVAPEGTCGLKISDFDYTLEVYQKDEPDHFAKYVSRFYFLNNPEDDAQKQIELHLSLGDNTVLNSKNEPVCDVLGMRYNKNTIYIKLKYKDSKDIKTWQLRKFNTIKE